MAASDKNYRDPKRLDLVFGVSSLILLVSVICLFVQDYYQPWKDVQRKFRDVDSSITQQLLLTSITEKDLDAAEAAEKEAKEARVNLQKVKAQHAAAIRTAQTAKDKVAEKVAGYAASRDEVASTVSIVTDKLDHADKTEKAEHAAELKKHQATLDKLLANFSQANLELEKVDKELADKLKPVEEAEQTLSEKEKALKSITDKVDGLAKALTQKTYKSGDFIRSLPVLDGFASPWQIKQVTLESLPIDYSFKHVTRYDRCTTCHLGIEDEKFSKEVLGAEPGKQQELLARLKKFYALRQANGENLGFSPSDLPGSLLATKLTEAQKNQYCVHPRLDLFVDANSPHPVEKFGCSSCHSGQGSATNFSKASHSPNNLSQRQRWEKDNSWEEVHAGDWEYPMLPSRFVESSCLKCHHQVTDLIRHGSKEEAPKLTKGYNTIREFGCYGCHEISSLKGGKVIGPDLRLEPGVPLEYLTPAEREKVLADKANPPGKLRKVGPSLYRLAEKTNQEWLRRWINDPRGFRPDTKMPHFYNLSNNDPNDKDALPEDQKTFPHTEIHALAYYLSVESGNYLKKDDVYTRSLKARQEELSKKEKKTKTEENELAELAHKLAHPEATAPNMPLRASDIKPIGTMLKDGAGNEVALPAVSDKAGIAEGARLFREKGCLACHSHDAAGRPSQDEKGSASILAVPSTSNFGPNLSRLAYKLKPELSMDTDQAKRAWLTQWILNPMLHHPRTRMPITHLTAKQAAQLADWLLSDEAKKLSDEADKQQKSWEEAKLDEPESKSLIALARVYLAKAPGISQTELAQFAKEEGETITGIPADKKLASDADERRLQVTADKKISKEDLKWYIGRKSVGRLGCYGCHDIPGYESSKPIGTALNDWGRKDSEKLAFEDISAYVHEKYDVYSSAKVTKKKVKDKDDETKEVEETSVELLCEKGKPMDRKKELYEHFYSRSLSEHHPPREAFLHQKLVEPRSYDYHRARAWDDRLRMPQFKFARQAKQPTVGESEKETSKNQALAELSEAEAREAVMTFVLGLVAESIPTKYLNQPSPDRAAEVRGRQVLDKYNCGGCHQIRPGVYEMKLSEVLVGSAAKGKTLRDFLIDAHKEIETKQKVNDFPAIGKGHNAWEGELHTRNDRVKLFGVLANPNAKVEVANEAGDSEDVPGFAVRLARALRIRDGNTLRDLPAGELLRLPNAQKAMLWSTDEYGGNFTKLLADNYFTGADKDKNDVKYPRLPPPLTREGEKVQPQWLQAFLKNPGVIRPQERLFLRMPKFNMSDEEINDLVAYFVSVDRLENPGASTTNPYLQGASDPEAIFAQAGAYSKKLGDKLIEERSKELKPLWKEHYEKRAIPEAERELAAVEDGIKLAEKLAQNGKDAEKKLAEDNKKKFEAEKALIEKKIEDLKKRKDGEFKEELDTWKQRESYAADAYRLLILKTENGCLNCHQVGTMKPNSLQAPPLDLAAQRLRPDYMLRWVAHPERLITYSSPMIQYFKPKALKPDQKQLFHGSDDAEEHIRAVRDALLHLPAISDLPSNRNYRPGLAK